MSNPPGQADGSGVSVELPPALAALEEFMAGVWSLGTEIAFWRSNANFEIFLAATDELAAILQSVGGIPQPEDRIFQIRGNEEASLAEQPAVRTRLQELSKSVRSLMEDVPFQHRVGLLHRSLVKVYQQIYIVHGLLSAINCRLLRQDDLDSGRIPEPVAESAREDHQKLRESLDMAFPFWEREDWNVYDFVLDR